MSRSLWKLVSGVFERPTARPRCLRRRTDRSRLTTRLALEPLEDRCLLSYSIIDLGTLGGTTSVAYGINASGEVVGESTTAAGVTHAFLFYNGVMHDLGTLGGSQSEAFAINNSGQVVGNAATPGDTADPAFLYDASATPPMQALGTLGGTFGQGNAINASGQVVGHSTPRPGDTTYHAFLYDATATPPMQDLGTFGGTHSAAYGINASGRVVGYALTATGAQHAFLYDASMTPPMQDLDTFGGTYSNAYSINDSGKVVGFLTRPGDPGQHAFLYDPTATPPMRDLGTLGGRYSQAQAINASGQVVGVADTPDQSVVHAFVYNGTAIQDLNGLIPSGSGWVLNEARAINDNGQIVGRGTINGHSHAFLLTPLATVQNVYVNDGSAQRSLVTSLTVTFSTLVSLDPGAFEVRHQNGDLVTVNYTASVVGGQTVAVLTFAGDEIVGGSLADGNYTLTVRADHVHDASSQTPDTDSVTSFYRLFGDTQGHRTVDAADVALLFAAFGRHSGDPGYVAYLDYTGAGVIDDASLYAFIARYGTTLNP